MSRIRTSVGRLSVGRMLIRLPIEGALLGSNVLVVNKVVTQDANCTRDEGKYKSDDPEHEAR